MGKDSGILSSTDYQCQRFHAAHPLSEPRRHSLSGGDASHLHAFQACKYDRNFTGTAQHQPQKRSLLPKSGLDKIAAEQAEAFKIQCNLAASNALMADSGNHALSSLNSGKKESGASSDRVRVHMCHSDNCFRIFPSKSRLLRHEGSHARESSA